MAQSTLPVGRAENLSSDAIALQTSVDLVPKDVGLDGLGQVVFTLQNRGDMNINADKYTIAGKNMTTPPIKIDLYLDNVMVQSVYLPSFGARETRIVSVKPISNLPKCKEVRAIKVVVDAANVIKEFRDDNNAASATAARPCPDLTVQSIDRVTGGIAGETYQVRVTVINQGNAAAPTGVAWATTMSSAPGVTGWPNWVPVLTIPMLAPGQTFTFRLGGSVMSFDNSWVKIFLDRDKFIDELNEENNLVEKKV